MALLVLAIAGLLWLRPAKTPHVGSPATPTGSQSTAKAGDVFAYEFLSPSAGWAAVASSPTSSSGPLWVFKTEDGAKHWERQLSGQSASIFLTINSLQMLDKSSGFLVAGDPLMLYRTTDGGAHWATLEIPHQDLLAVDFSDPQNGWFLAQSQSSPPTYAGTQLYATVNAGTSWTRLPDPPTDLLRIVFRGPHDGWAGVQGASHPPRVYTTEDSGRSWQKHDLPMPPGHQAIDSNSTGLQLLPGAGVAATIGYLDAIYQLTSFDNGHSWTFTTHPPSVNPTAYPSYAFEDSLHWWAIVDSGLFKSTDAGRSWAITSTSTPSGLSFVRVFNSRVAWARFAYSFGSEIAMTSDGGLHWTKAKVPSPSGST
jgi:photosystem II stability/assembly factor-like uncharacterized protein